MKKEDLIYDTNEKPPVKEWIILLDKMDDELTRDGNRHAVERAASYMLMKWASIVTER